MQPNDPSRKQKTLSMALVALFFVSGLGVLLNIAEPAEAIRGTAPPQPAGGLDILTPTIGVDPGAGDESAVIKVRNPAATGVDSEDFAITKFIMTINSSIAYPESPIKRFLPADSDIDQNGWVISETQDCDGPDRNLLPGWGNCVGLLFEAMTEDDYVYPGTEVEFEIAYEPVENIRYCTYGGHEIWYDDTPSLRVIGQHNYISESAAPPGPHITSRISPEAEDPDHFFVKLIIDDHDSPEALEEAQVESGLEVPTTYIVDEDHNGHIDHAYILFDKELDPTTIDVRDFEVGKADPDQYPVLEVEVINATDPYGDRMRPLETADGYSFCPNYSMVKLKFDEEDTYDTDATPNLKYRKKPGVVKDADPREELVLTSLAAVRVDSTPIVEPVDRALPILASATLRFDEEEERNNVDVLFHLSEPVGRSQGNTACDPENPVKIEGLRVEDFMIFQNNPDTPSGLITWDPPTQLDGDPEANDAHMTPTAVNDPFPKRKSDNEPIEWAWLHFKTNTSAWVNGRPLGFNHTDLEYRFEDDGPFTRIEENPIPDRFRFSNSAWICDVANNAAYERKGTIDDPNEPLAPPAIVSADGNIGFDKITVEFTVPVNISEQKLVNGEVLDVQPNEVFTLAAAREVGAGVVEIIHTPCSEKAIIKLSRPLTAADVSGDPTFLRVEANRVFTCNAGLHSIAPDVSEFEDEGWPLRAQDREIVDVTPPSVVFALTRDIDGNGEVDAYEFWMSEPVQDTSFEYGNPGNPHVIIEVVDHIKYKRLDVGEPDDRFLTIGFQPLSADQGYATHRIPQVTAFAKNVSGRWQGMVMDRAFNEDLRTGNWMTNATFDDIKELDGAPPRVMVAETLDRDENGLLDAYRLTFSEPVKDSSFRPEHWFVGPDHMYPVIGLDHDPEWDREANDAVLILEFEEKEVDGLKPIGDTGLPHKPPELTYFAPPGEGIEDMADLPASLGGPNRMLNFGTDKIVERDSAPPVLMAALACQETDRIQLFLSEGVVSKDTEDQSARKLDSDDFFYSNGGGPVAGLREDSAEHIQGDQIVLINTDARFSPDDFGTDKVKVADDPKEDVDEEQGIIQEIDGPLHASVVREVTVERGRDIVPPDDIETLLFDPDRVFAGGLEFDVVVPHDDGCPDVDGGDVKDPATVGFVVKVNTTPISAQGFDSAPAVNASLIQYIWKDQVTGENLTAPSAEFPSLTDMVDDDLNGTGVLENETLSLRVTGLLPDTDYWMAIAPMDREGNVGAPTRTISFHTAIDLTAPEVPEDFEIRSPTHPEGVPSKNTEPEFEWDEAFDPESVHVVYRYALSKTSTYEVDPNQDPAAVGQSLLFTPKLISEFTNKAPTGLAPANWFEDPAEWYFHLSACSGGGCTPAGTYRILVDSPINRTELAEANALVETDIVYDEATGDYIVNWAFPSSGMPCEPNGVQIWRKDEGDAGFRHLATFGQNDRGFQDARFVDPDSKSATLDTKYLVTMKCPDEAVTYWDGDEFAAATVDGAGLFPSDKAPPTDDYAGTSARQVDAPFTVPLWVWIVLGVILLLVVIGIIAFFALREGSETELWEEGEIEEPEMGAFGSPDDAPPGQEPEAEDDKPQG